jgi:hypothetical protein
MKKAVFWDVAPCRYCVNRRENRKSYNIKMDLIEVGWDGMDWIDLVPDRGRWRALVNKVMNLRIHKMLGNS